uniref:NADH-ubiquinone oxidoreductase chain 4 n=1 Tax=Macracanthorhynchus hirudinaceus TaxID=1032456 RepID=K0JA76_MACHR|nr:NADH dehydrogenase subunit 4 [Macracanthorhynchus hirudinaceus]CCA94497.2 NADH Dehydrogenase subunit 4 [Macracanthorhynchus hirudinaceus]
MAFVSFIVVSGFVDGWLLVLMMMMVVVVHKLMGVVGSFSFIFGMEAMDSLSVMMVELSVYIVSLGMMWAFMSNGSKFMWGCGAVMVVALLVLFISASYLIFYLMYEITVLLLVVMVALWGSNPERLVSLIYLVVYMLGFSMPMFFVLMYVISLNGVSVFWSISNVSVVMMIVVFFAMFVKIPVYLVHYWLPKVHVEASTGVSMILAGILLKMGGYGFFRFYCMWGLSVQLSEVVMSVSLIGVIISAVMCIYLSDLKEIVAYSSVVHMGLMVSVLVMMKMAAFIGVVSMLLFHGFTSMMLFHLVGYVYMVVESRSLMVVKSLVKMGSLLSMVFFVSLIMNMGFPLTGNFLAEIYLVPILVTVGGLVGVVLVLYLFIGCVYNILVYVYLLVGGSESVWGEMLVMMGYLIMFLWSVVVLGYVLMLM